MDELQQCCTCRWGWDFENEDPEWNDTRGTCHRHAPRPAAQGSYESQGRILWPVVRISDGCGEWTTRFTDT
jgi:hypothetical protein